MSPPSSIEVYRPSGNLPAMSIEEARTRFQQMAEFVRSVMREGSDYGVIPGASAKPVLLKPGAEKLCSLFGLTIPDPVILSEVEDWTGERHGGEPFFYYRVLQRLERDGRIIASQFGSCNSRETKFRWRAGERQCPRCGKGAIIKGKDAYGGGWVCFGKKGGCGAKFRDGEQAIETQSVGRVANPDICDLVNTIQKMAEKRALIGSVLLAVNASEFFTQDLDDLADSEPVRIVVEPEPAPSPAPAQQPSQQPGRKPAQTPDPRQAEVDATFPVGPPKPGAMFLQLQAKEAALVAEGLCQPGELIAHLRAVGEEQADFAEVELWSGPRLREFAASEIQQFETHARKAAAAKPATAPAPATNGQATTNGQRRVIDQNQVSLLAHACHAKGIHFRDLCRMLGISPETDIATLNSPVWQKAMQVAISLPDPQTQGEKQPQAEAATADEEQEVEF